MDLKILILQILNEQDALTIIEAQEKISVMDLLFKGGFMIIPILLLFIITIYIFIERILVINIESKSPKNFTDEMN